uniref:Glyco_transf_20 domain-containing protein n=1 Tax=Heterorhabditis bacteriophora TaxID=37862 RepID=A0A1I7WNV9_HETBA
MNAIKDDCIAIAAEINNSVKSEEYPDWLPVRFETDGLPRTRLVAYYLAMDVGVVTPSKDGMNLVAKEMMVCNPGASLVLSTGAGTEASSLYANFKVQLVNAGFYSDDKKCYHRVDDISDIESFAEVFYRAAIEGCEVRKEHGGHLNQFLKSHDIDEWSSAFLDPSWTHEVIRPSEVVLKGMPIRPHFALSLENAKVCFLTISFVLTPYYTTSYIIMFASLFQSSISFTVFYFEATANDSRDGTLKSYSCSYPTSVQPAYSAVIQAQFARRCAQFCAIVTTAPLVHIGILNMSTMPEGSKSLCIGYFSSFPMNQRNVKINILGRRFIRKSRLPKLYMDWKWTSKALWTYNYSQTRYKQLCTKKEEYTAFYPGMSGHTNVFKSVNMSLKVTHTCHRFHNYNVTFVSCPEVLLGAMAQATVRELNIRGITDNDRDDM